MSLVLENVRKDNHSLNLEERSQGKLVIQSMPLVAKIEVTTRCNLRCTMCSVSYREKGDNGDHLDFELFQKLEPTFPTLLSAYLYGIGEPLLHPQIDQMMDLLLKNDVRVGFITNGMLIDEAKVEQWVAKQLYKVSVSLDGATQLIYEKIRRWGNFEKLRNNLSLLRDEKKRKSSLFPYLTLNFVVMRDNVQDLVPLIEMAKEYEAKEVILTELLPFIPEMKGQVLIYDDPILIQNYKKAEAKAKSYGIDLVFPHTYQRWKKNQNASEKIDVAREESLLNKEGAKQFDIPFANCTEPWSGFWLTQKGEVTPCCYWFKPMGNLKEASFQEIWNNENYQALRKTINHPESRHQQCVRCPIPSGN